MPEITLVLHNIRSTYNVGAIFRSAEGFAVHDIVISGYTPYPQLSRDSRLPHISAKLTAQIHKTALGAENMIPFQYYRSLDDWIAINKETIKLPLIALEQAANSVNLGDFQPPKSFALLLGEEVHGISEQYLRVVDQIIEIPMHGQKESFNVAVATGIALYALQN